ncbi:MAG: thermonuclease family protein [Candidatus Omnitrophica bacterium]|nr:thermonuclease family protein [Candidatus Omnitrophota bacterium]
MPWFLGFLILYLVIFPQGVFTANPSVATYEELLSAIRQTRQVSRERLEAAARAEKVREAWETGKLIDEHILQHQERAEYGKEVIPKLAKDLGTSETELYHMLAFARTYPILAVPRELSWAHYRELLSVHDPEERAILAEKAAREGWSSIETRQAVKAYKAKLEPQNRELETGNFELETLTPGPLYTYPIIRLKDRPKIDLGFGIYLDLAEEDAGKFQDGDIATLADGKLTQAEGATAGDLYTYPAVVTSVVDGDTFHALIDLGFGITLAQRVRLRRIDAPELITAEGKDAKEYLENLLRPVNGAIVLQSHELDQHGRPIADVWTAADEEQGKDMKWKSLDEELVREGHAVAIE